MINHSFLAMADKQIQSLPSVGAARKSEYETYLRDLSPTSQELAESWLRTSIVPVFEFKGMTVERLVRVMRAHPLVAIIMLDRLMKDHDVYRPAIRLKDDEFVFVLRDAPSGFVPPKPVASALTTALSEAVSDYLEREEVDPPELRMEAPWPVQLSIVVGGAARAVDVGELVSELDDLRQVIELAGEIPEGTDQPLSEIQRIGLVLRLIEALATDDLRALRAAGNAGKAEPEEPEKGEPEKS
jgi:hypothetical protein